jgi:hypothetical protein
LGSLHVSSVPWLSIFDSCRWGSDFSTAHRNREFIVLPRSTDGVRPFSAATFLSPTVFQRRRVVSFLLRRAHRCYSFLVVFLMPPSCFCSFARRRRRPEIRFAKDARVGWASLLPRIAPPLGFFPLAGFEACLRPVVLRGARAPVQT